MTNVLQRSLKADLPIIDHGDGIWLYGEDGRKFIDAGLAPATCALGHCHPKVVETIQKQVAKLHFAHTSRFSNRPVEDLADMLIATCPPSFARVFFALSGSDAVEGALKLARQFAVETGELARTRFVGRRNDYHGATTGALSVSDRPARMQFSEGQIFDVSFAAPAYAYRYQQPTETEEEYGRRAADDLERVLREVGPETVAAFIVETVNGTGLGVVPPPAGYLRRVREICDRHGVLLIFDEVLCGMGYTGTLHAFEQEDVVPDLLVLGKGLGAGYQPLSAVVASAAIVNAILSGTGTFTYSQTYQSHALGCAAALAVQSVIQEEDLVDRVRERGEQLHKMLVDGIGGHPNVGNIRGRGFLQAVEFVESRESKKPFDLGISVAQRVRIEAFKAGLLCFGGGGEIDGTGDHSIVSPPFITSNSDLDRIAELFCSAVERAVATL